MRSLESLRNNSSASVSRESLSAQFLPGVRVARINRDLPNRKVRSFRSKDNGTSSRRSAGLRRLVFCEFCDWLVASQLFADRLFTICNSAELEKTRHASRHVLRKI